jgi:N-acetylglucosamine-6-sulfatase
VCLADQESRERARSGYVGVRGTDGGFQGEHRIQRGKNRTYEESARVPFFVRGPGVAAGAKAEKLALNTDLAPTSADLAGVSFPADGRTLAPLLGGEEDPSWRTAILLEKLSQRESDDEVANEEEGGKAKGKGKGKAKGKNKGKAGPSNSLDYQAIRTETHKYVEYNNGDVELYDLRADPYEMESFHESADPALVEDLKAKLEAPRSCSEEGCQEAEDAP